MKLFAWAAGAALLSLSAQAAEMKAPPITGAIVLPTELTDAVAAGDRLAIKMYHPDEGIEKDLKYWILDEFAFPQKFAVAPTVNMAGNPRWDTYVIEVFTDRDRNVLNLVEGEIWASTSGPLPLGTGDIELILARPSR